MSRPTPPGGAPSRAPRSPHVDIIKGWAMLTIIVCHCQGTGLRGLGGHLFGSPWNVPVFFIVAGFFLRVEAMAHPLSFVRGKLRRLYLPATVIYGLCVALHNLFVRVGWYPLGASHPASGEPFHYYGWREALTRLARVLAAGGSGELAMGAMWFLYTLLYAFVAMSALYWLVARVTADSGRRFRLMTVLLALIAAGSCALTALGGVFVSRLSVAATAMGLVWLGAVVWQKWRWTFDKPWCAVLAAVVFTQGAAMLDEDVRPALNVFPDAARLCAFSLSAMYVWGFVGRRIAHTLPGRLLALMGCESLYLMAFHIIGFFLCNSLLSTAGVFGPDSKVAYYTYDLGGRLPLTLLYTLFGVSVPLLLIGAFRRARGLVARRVARGRATR